MALDTIKESEESSQKLPEWLITLFPELKRLFGDKLIPSDVLKELEKSHQHIEDAQIFLKSITDADAITLGLPRIQWTNQTARTTFAKDYIKNFRTKVIMRKAPNNTTKNTFFNDLDAALKLFDIKLPLDLIHTSINGENKAKTAAGETINELLVPVVLHLRLKGYALFDLIY